MRSIFLVSSPPRRANPGARRSGDRNQSSVMAGHDPAIHVLLASSLVRKSWMPGTSPGMTELVLPATASEKDFTVSTSREYWERIRPAFLTGILVNLLARGQALFG